MLVFALKQVKMSQARSFNNLPKVSASRQGKQQNPKGCCCKRSQCIKNYCDCYQSMTMCSIYCKCVGCRNTEERLAVATPKKSAFTAKRERAAALTAKAAAAAAKAGINIQMKQTPGPVSFMGQKFGLQVQPMAVLPQPEIMHLPDADFENVITLPPPNAATVPKKSVVAQSTPIQIPPPAKEFNIFKHPVNAAMLDCMISQAAEAEELGMNEQEVGKLVLHEFSRNLQSIINVLNP